MIYAAEKFDFPKLPFVFIRHGETDANRAGIIAGSNEPPLNDTGREQALAIAPLMAQANWRAVYVSFARTHAWTAAVRDGKDRSVPTRCDYKASGYSTDSQEP